MDLKTAFSGITLVAVLLSIYLGYRHYNALLEDFATTKENVGKLEVALKTQTATTEQAVAAIAEWQNASRQILVDLEKTNQAAGDARDEVRKLQESLDSHDLAALAYRRPGLTLRALNRGTDRAARLLECHSTVEREDCDRISGAAKDNGSPSVPATH